MSQNQFPSDDHQDGAQSPQGSEEAQVNPSQPEAAPSLPEEYEFAGTKFSREEVEKTMGNWRNMQAAHTQRSQAVAEERRDLEAREAELARREAALRGVNPTASEAIADDDPFAVLARGQQQINDRLNAWEQRQQEAEAATQQEHATLQAVQGFKGQPFYDAKLEDEMLEYMDANNLGPQHAHVAYSALTGYRAGMSIGEQNAMARQVPVPVMGSTGAPGVSPEITDLSQVQPPMDPGQISWQSLEEQAASDDGVR